MWAPRGCQSLQQEQSVEFCQLEVDQAYLFYLLFASCSSLSVAPQPPRMLLKRIGSIVGSHSDSPGPSHRSCSSTLGSLGSDCFTTTTSSSASLVLFVTVALVGSKPLKSRLTSQFFWSSTRRLPVGAEEADEAFVRPTADMVPEGAKYFKLFICCYVSSS
jgi:hypothetical protein